LNVTCNLRSTTVRDYLWNHGRIMSHSQYAKCLDRVLHYCRFSQFKFCFFTIIKFKLFTRDSTLYARKMLSIIVRSLRQRCRTCMRRRHYSSDAPTPKSKLVFSKPVQKLEQKKGIIMDMLYRQGKLESWTIFVNIFVKF